MTISEERKKRVIDLYYNQGKTTREIAKIEKMSIRNISTIFKEEEARRQKYKVQQRQEETSSKAYKLFSDGKHPVDVAIALSLREPEAIRLYREYWRLQGLDKLNTIYQETNGKIWPLWKLYKHLIKEKSMGIEKVANAVEIAVNRLPYMESLYRQAKDEVDKMQHTRQEMENNLHTLNDEIACSKQLLQSYHISCQRKRQEVEYLNNEITRLEALVRRFKSNNKEYLKINQIVEEKVSSVLKDGKVLLQFALASVIEAIRRNPGKYNNPLVSAISSSSSTSTDILTQQSPLWHIDGYKDIVLDEANRLYDILLKYFTKSIMDNVGHASSSSDSKLSSTFNLDTYNQSNTYRIESERFHHTRDNIAD